MTDETRQQIETLLHAGHSDLDIHQQTGAARTTVARYRKRLGLPGYKAREDSPTCRHGHPYPENAVRGSDGWLRCRGCTRIRHRAVQRRAYIPAQPDEMAIERAAAGDPPERLTPRERHAAIRQIDRTDLSAAGIAQRVRCSKRTVHRARSRVTA